MLRFLTKYGKCRQTLDMISFQTTQLWKIATDFGHVKVPDDKYLEKKRQFLDMLKFLTVIISKIPT